MSSWGGNKKTLDVLIQRSLPTFSGTAKNNAKATKKISTEKQPRKNLCQQNPFICRVFYNFFCSSETSSLNLITLSWRAISVKGLIMHFLEQELQLQS